MLQTLRRGQRWVLWFVIIVVGGVFVFFMGLGGGFTPSGSSVGTVVNVDGRTFDVRDVDRLRRRQEEAYRQQLGKDFNAAATRPYLEQQAAGALMRLGLLIWEGRNLGLRVTDEEIRRFLRTVPGAVGPDGRLDQAAITNTAEREFGSVRRFQENLRDQLLADKVSRLLAESVAVSDGEVRDALFHDLEEVQIAAVVLDRKRAPAGLRIDPEKARALLAEDRPRVRALYDERIEEFDQPEQVRARHILIRIPDGGEDAEEEARQRAEATRQRILDGADFVDVALEVSEDPGSQSAGGDLGYFPRGRMVPAFEEAAFALEPGVVSEVVRSSHGFHVIRVEEKRAAETTPFEQVAESLAEQLLRDEAASEAAEAQAEALLVEIRDGRTLIDAAREAELVIERPDPFRRRPDGVISGLGRSSTVMNAAFALSEEAPVGSRSYAMLDKLVLIELIERTRPSEAQVEAAMEEKRGELVQARREALETAWLGVRQRELSDSGRLLLDLSPLQL